MEATRIGSKVHITGNCECCDDPVFMIVQVEGFEEWINGKLIQHALPELSLAEREVLISGLCESCFDEITKEKP